MSAKRAKKDDAVAELAEEMLRVLGRSRDLGPVEYPLTLEQLGRLAHPQAGRQQVFKAALKKSFTAKASVARRSRLDAPVVLQEDLQVLAASPLTLKLALRLARSPTIHARTVSQLSEKLAGRLQKPFREEVGRQVETGGLPPDVAWIRDRRPKLFLLEDLQPESLRRRVQAGAAGPIEPATPAAQTPQPEDTAVAPAARTVPQPSKSRVEAPPEGAGTGDFAACFELAFDELDRRKGSHNFVSLVDLRRRLAGFSRGQFDAGLRGLRLAGRFSLSAAESVHGIQPEQRQAGIEEAGTLLLYVLRKTP